MASEVNLQEFVAGFILEADEHLHSVNHNLVLVSEALRAGRLEPRAVRELFRSFHTIKGLASMVGAGPIVDISHELEGLLRTADRAGGQLSEVALDLLVKGTQVIEERVKSIPKVGVSGIQKISSRLIQELIHLQSSDLPKTKPSAGQDLQLPKEILSSLTVGDREQVLQGLAAHRKLILVDFEPSPENMAVGLNITTIRERIHKIAELIKVAPHSAVRAPTGIAFYLLILTELNLEDIATVLGVSGNAINEVEVKEPVASDEEKALLSILEEDDFEDQTSSTESESASVRVNIRKLDEVLERLSELIVTRSKLTKITEKMSAKGIDTRELNAIVSENGRQLKRLRTAVTQARMVSLAELLQRLPLVVRGLTKDLGKSIDVFIQAGSAEVDKAVADKIFPAIIHIIRNSVDHAIESKTERKNSGKDETGVITVHCEDSSGTALTITIKDDGRGIDREAVARKSGQPVANKNEELLKQICTPGLSTREDVSLTSGRGMGMDIVKKTLEMLGGSLSLSTQEGKGTVFILRVPVSITIIDVMSFISGGQVFVAPVAMIDEILEVDPTRLSLSPSITGHGPQPRLLSRRGETIPFLVLESVLKNQPEQTIPSRAIVVNQLNGAVAFGIDRMLGQQEVVIRPLDDSLIRTKGMNGATDLGDGHPTLVLDLASLGAEYASTAEVHL